MNIRPSTPNQHFACRTINTLTGIPLPENYAINFHACHAYIGMYYNNAKYIRDTHPIHRSDWREPPQPQPYEPERYSRLHEAIANAVTADPIQLQPHASQRAAIMFIREQLGVIPPPDVIRYRSAATEFINEHYANARARFDMRRSEPMPTGLSYAGPSPSDPERVIIRRWPDNYTAPQPRPLTEGALISPTPNWDSLNELEPDDAPSEETLKDLIARQFNAR